MAPDPSPSSRETEIEHEAAAWLARRDRGLTAREQDEFFQWLADDPRHGEWLARHQQTVAGLKSLAQWRPEHGAQPNPDLLAAPRPRAVQLRHRPARWLVLAGLAAATCATLIIWWTPSAPSRAKATLAETPLIIRKVLEDGSSIDLNHGAVVEVTYTPGIRQVRLVKGEANFNVAKNQDRPFIVDAAGVQVRAVGTAFNVNLQAKAVEVLVTEGKVSVDRSKVGALASNGLQLVGPPLADAPSDIPSSVLRPPSPAVLLGAGQRTVVSLVPESAAPQIESVPSREMARVLAWQPRQLEFNDTPLAQVVAEFNGDNRIKMVVDDPVLAAVPVGASLRSDNVEGFVRLLEASFNVKAERRPDGVIVLRRAD